MKSVSFDRQLLVALGMAALGFSLLWPPVSQKNVIIGMGWLLLAALQLKWRRDAQKDVGNDQ